MDGNQNAIKAGGFHGGMKVVGLSGGVIGGASTTRVGSHGSLKLSNHGGINTVSFAAGVIGGASVDILGNHGSRIFNNQRGAK